MPQTPLHELEDSPSEPTTPDVVAVIDRVAHIENVINQIIVGYCRPRKAAWRFMWSILLDTSVMTLGAKVKIVMAIAHEIDLKIDRNALHRVIALRNAFAHHASNAYPVIAEGKTPEEDTSYLELWVLESSGQISRVKRHEALAEFNASYRIARTALVQLRNLVNERYPPSDA